MNKVSTRRKQKSIPQNVVIQLFQDKPEWGCPVRHGFKKTTWYGSIARAKRRADQLLTNCAIISKKTGSNWFYPYDGTIKVQQELSVNDHRKLREAITSALKKLGCSFTWDCEVSRKNLIDYHFTFRHAPADLMANRGRKIKAILKKLTDIRLNIQFREIETYKACVNQCNYVTKSKRSGFKKKQRPNMATDDVDVICNTTDTTPSEDIHAKKRVLFVKGCGLHKDGDSGDFWDRTKKEREADYTKRKQAKQTAKKKNPYAETAAKRLAEITDLHEAAIERKLHDEYEAEQDPAQRNAIRQQNKELADAYHRDTPEYAEETQYREEQRQKQERQAKFHADIDTLQQRKPFNPADCETILPTTTTYGANCYGPQAQTA